MINEVKNIIESLQLSRTQIVEAFPDLVRVVMARFDVPAAEAEKAVALAIIESRRARAPAPTAANRIRESIIKGEGRPKNFDASGP